MALLLVLVCGSAAAAPTHTLVDRVKDGPAAGLIRESFRALESGEEATDRTARLAFYERGRVLAEQALAIDERNADAHFARFANWGRVLQEDGWLKHTHHLPTLWGELDRALELDPDHSPSLGAKGGLYAKLPWFLGGSKAQAEPLLHRAIETDPHVIGSRLELAECYVETDRPKAARELAELALRLAEEQEKPRYVNRARQLLTRIGDEDPQTAAAKSAARPWM